MRGVLTQLLLLTSILILALAPKSGTPTRVAGAKGIRVDLPHTCNETELIEAGDDDHGIFIHYTPRKTAYINGYGPQPNLADEVHRTFQDRMHKTIYVAADQALQYGSVLGLLNDIKTGTPDLTFLLVTRQQTGKLATDELPSHRPPPSGDVCVYPV